GECSAQQKGDDDRQEEACAARHEDPGQELGRGLRRNVVVWPRENDPGGIPVAQRRRCGEHVALTVEGGAALACTLAEDGRLLAERDWRTGGKRALTVVQHPRLPGGLAPKRGRPIEQDHPLSAWAQVVAVGGDYVHERLLAPHASGA